MTVQGRVTAVNGDRAEVEYMRYSACGRACNTCKGCESRPSVLTAANTRKAHVGDTVEVLLPEESVSLLALAVYALPIALVFGLAYAAYALLAHTAAAVAGAFAGAGLWLFILLRVNARVERTGRYCGRITAILNKTTTEGQDDQTEA